MTQFRFEPGESRFTVQAFVDGLLSFLGHSPIFTVQDFSGSVSFEDGRIDRMLLDLAIPTRGLTVSGDIKPADRREIEERMRSEVLEVQKFPEIGFRAAATADEKLAPGRYRVRLAGELSLHGATRPLRVEMELAVFPDGVQIRGETSVRMSEFGIRPVTALAGTIKLKDEVKLTFDLFGRPEAS